MTTREDLIDGLKMIVREGLRTTATFGPDDWTYTVHDEENGWNTKQVYCHLTAIAEILPGMASQFAQAGDGVDAAAGIDVGAMNAQAVAAKEQLSEADLMQEFQVSHEKAIEFVTGMPEEQLQHTLRVMDIQAPLAEILDTLVILHGVMHIYHAQDRSGH